MNCEKFWYHFDGVKMLKLYQLIPKLLTNFLIIVYIIEAPSSTKPAKLPADVVLLPLTNARQSSTFTTSGCTRNRCVPSRAIDGHMNTVSVTKHDSDFQWWRAQLPYQSRVYQVIISSNKWAYDV